MIKTAILGFGNVGKGVARVLDSNRDEIARKVPGGLELGYILDIRDFPDSPFADKVTHDYEDILNDPDVRVICETMGGKEPAFTFSKRALEKGISVCTSNKELVEARGCELLAIAKEHGCSYLFEASVGGGIPLIAPLLNCLEQERITSIIGILNGTTNYILTKMDRFGEDYASILKEAQELGYAERNPEADVEGHDTGRKISILSFLVSGKTIRFADTYTEGITKISPADFTYAENHHYSIKLLGVSRRSEDESYNVHTAPYLVPEGHPLHAVSDVFNGVFIHGNMVDNLMFYGRGAGTLPTGSAVVADMVQAALHCGSTIEIRWDPEVVSPTPHEQVVNTFFVRVPASGEDAARKAFEGRIAEEWTLEAVPDEFAFITSPMTEGDFARDAEGLELLSRIRVLQG